MSDNRSFIVTNQYQEMGSKLKSWRIGIEPGYLPPILMSPDSDIGLVRDCDSNWVEFETCEFHDLEPTLTH